jgi:hypothetical protein
MQEATSQNWDLALLIVPFLIIMVINMFRMEERLATPKKQNANSANHRRFCGPDQRGELVIFDPDGHRLPTERNAHSPHPVPLIAVNAPIVSRSSGLKKRVHNHLEFRCGS